MAQYEFFFTYQSGELTLTTNSHFWQRCCALPERGTMLLRCIWVCVDYNARVKVSAPASILYRAIQRCLRVGLTMAGMGSGGM